MGARMARPSFRRWRLRPGRERRTGRRLRRSRGDGVRRALYKARSSHRRHARLHLHHPDARPAAAPRGPGAAALDRRLSRRRGRAARSGHRRRRQARQTAGDPRHPRRPASRRTSRPASRSAARSGRVLSASGRRGRRRSRRKGLRRAWRRARPGPNTSSSVAASPISARFLCRRSCAPSSLRATPIPPARPPIRRCGAAWCVVSGRASRSRSPHGRTILRRRTRRRSRISTTSGVTTPSWCRSCSTARISSTADWATPSTAPFSMWRRGSMRLSWGARGKSIAGLLGIPLGAWTTSSAQSSRTRIEEATETESEAGPEPWRHPVTDIGDVLDDAARIMKKYVAAPDTHFDTVALWCLHTHLIHREELGIDVTPRLGFQSPEEDSGKSTFMKLVARAGPAPQGHRLDMQLSAVSRSRRAQVHIAGRRSGLRLSRRRQS